MSSQHGSAYLSESHQPQLYSAYISTYMLAIIAVCLRLSARKYFSKAGVWLDDYWALLVLPIPYIWRLHQIRAQKVALCGVFGLGGLYVPCIARLSTFIRPKIPQGDTNSCDIVFVSSPLFAFT